MEFSHVGQHCDVKTCKLHDFLPFECDACKGKFCLEHRSYAGHECSIGWSSKDLVMPTCPICSQVVFIKKGEDPNVRVDQHIAQGCPKEQAPTAASLPQKFKCTHRGCTSSEHTPIFCKFCGQMFCLKHRHENDHQCPRAPSSTSPPPSRPAMHPSPFSKPAAAASTARPTTATTATAAPVATTTTSSTYPSPFKSSTAAKVPLSGQLHKERQAALARQQASSSTSPSPPPPSTPPPTAAARPSSAAASGALSADRTAAAAALGYSTNFSTKKHTPIGDRNMEFSNRYNLSVYFPRGSGVDAAHMYFPKYWSVGRVVDAVAAHGKIKNENNVPGAQKLNLFSVRTGEQLPSSSTLQDLPRALLAPNEAVVLERADALDLESLSAALTASGVAVPACSIS